MERSVKELAKWRMEKAGKTLSDARELYRLGMFQICLNRSYEDMYEPDQGDAALQLENAAVFVSAVSSYLSKCLDAVEQ